MKQIKELEKRFIELYEDFKKIIPDTSMISLNVNEYSFGIHLSGFYHFSDGCKMLNSVDDLIRLSILSRKFK